MSQLRLANSVGESRPRPRTSGGDGPASVTALDLRMMERALDLARQAASMGEVPVGAVIYRGTEIIAEGYNLREKSCDPVAHAELLAMSRAGRRLGEWRLNDCSLAVTLEPCPMCAGAMVNSRLGRVIYGAHTIRRRARVAPSIASRMTTVSTTT